MNTVTEVFYQEEITPLIADQEQLDKWHEMVETLGLDGQKDLAQEDKSPIPFLPLKKREKKILSTICPVTAPMEKYNFSPIPIEVLGAIALSKKEGYFERIEIWRDNVKPDPVAIGIISPEKNQIHFLIARWGAEKLSWENLTKEAAKRIKANILEEAKRRMNELNEMIKDPDHYVEKRLNDQWFYI